MKLCEAKPHMEALPAVRVVIVLIVSSKFPSGCATLPKQFLTSTYFEADAPLLPSVIVSVSPFVCPRKTEIRLFECVLLTLEVIKFW